MSYTLKKSLGQHFLHDDGMCRKIANVVAGQNPERLLEIGPGGGAISRYLMQIPGCDYKLVEIDGEKVVYLRSTFPALAEKIIHQDILQVNPPFNEDFAIAGNFPYNISTEIVFKILDWKQQVKFVVGMFQKEVAQRLAASPNSKVYGVTSVLTQAYFSIEYLFDVHPQCFTPPPKVMSGVILMKPKTPPEMKSPAVFTRIVKAAFQQRRKQLRNPLKPYFSKDVLADEIFTRRAENLSVEDFARLSFLTQ